MLVVAEEGLDDELATSEGEAQVAHRPGGAGAWNEVERARIAKSEPSAADQRLVSDEVQCRP